MVSALVSGSGGLGSSPGRGHCVVFLDCRERQKLSYHFSFCYLSGPCTRRIIYFNVSELWSKNFHFNSKTQQQCFCYIMAAMFVPVRRAQTWRLHTKLYKFGWHNSANSTRMKNSRELNFGEVVCIICNYLSYPRFLNLFMNSYDF